MMSRGPETGGRSGRCACLRSKSKRVVCYFAMKRRGRGANAALYSVGVLACGHRQRSRRSEAEVTRRRFLMAVSLWLPAAKTGFPVPRCSYPPRAKCQLPLPNASRGILPGCSTCRKRAAETQIGSSVVLVVGWAQQHRGYRAIRSATGPGAGMQEIGVRFAWGEYEMGRVFSGVSNQKRGPVVGAWRSSGFPSKAMQVHAEARVERKRLEKSNERGST